jgi:hypothetical protein
MNVGVMKCSCEYLVTTFSRGQMYWCEGDDFHNLRIATRDGVPTYFTFATPPIAIRRRLFCNNV